MLIRAIAVMLEAASTSETSVTFCEITRCNVPEAIHLRSKLGRCGLVKSRVTADHETFMFINSKRFSLRTGAAVLIG
jgi:hypothetical protein